MATPITAIGAYAAAAKLLSDPAQSAAVAAGEGGAGSTSFTSVLKEALDSVNEAGRKSDAQTRAMVNGKSNMVDVVTAVSETEVAIDAVVAVRDKVIAAYEDIMKMPI
ncbi:MAG TPA: flagellar hook-basal body complex protein FliE [Pseudolabrys sp.]|jgi:flagellar hook-basal body complex protein FliE|nr:flagellar hook-basal body complex protein FliE [Pseudolabrys sp.]